MDTLMIKHKNWLIQQNIYLLFKFVLPMFEVIFGEAIMSKEACCVEIDENNPAAPIFVTNSNPIRIILSANHKFWCQVIYQLSHELTHYAVRQNTIYQYATCAVSAFEEPAAESMSMYIIKLCGEQWDNCDLYSNNPGYAKYLDEYKRNIYANINGEKPKTYSEWEYISKGYTGTHVNGAGRPNVSIMRNYLYDTFVDMPSAIEAFIRYPLYLHSIPYELLIDGVRWEEHEPENTEFIRKICSIQPQMAVTP